jgi:hypothetical protein
MGASPVSFPYLAYLQTFATFLLSLFFSFFFRHHPSHFPSETTLRSTPRGKDSVDTSTTPSRLVASQCCFALAYGYLSLVHQDVLTSCRRRQRVFGHGERRGRSIRTAGSHVRVLQSNLSGDLGREEWEETTHR